MSDCNATLTTETVEVHDGVTITNIHKLTCNLPRRDHQTYTFLDEVYEMHQPMETRSGGLWGDDWPGATPHTPPLVTDEEVQAFTGAYQANAREQYDPAAFRAALEAAARVRQENDR